MLALLPLVVPLLAASLAACAPSELEPAEASSAACSARKLEPAEAPDDAAMLQTNHLQRPSEAKPRPRIVYGVLTTGLPEFRAKLVSQVETWASGLVEQGRFFAVAGANSTKYDAGGVIVEDRCADDRSGIACKEERVQEEGYDRGADWFVVLGEDNYVDMKRFEDTLLQRAASLDSATPTVLGALGCGMYSSPCPEVAKLGGVCGGSTYSLNRAALKALMANGKQALREEYRAKGVMQSDMATSCALRRRGVDFQRVEGGFCGNRIVKLVEFESVLQSKPLTLHYCTADVMRWVHAKLQQKPVEEVKALEAAAFDGGCCCSAGDGGVGQDHERCKEEVRKSQSTLQLAGAVVSKPADWEELAREYIEERNRQLSAESGF